MSNALASAYCDLAHLDNATTWPELKFSLSSPQEERVGEKRALSY